MYWFRLVRASVLEGFIVILTALQLNVFVFSFDLSSLVRLLFCSIVKYAMFAYLNRDQTRSLNQSVLCNEGSVFLLHETAGLLDGNRSHN